MRFLGAFVLYGDLRMPRARDCINAGGGATQGAVAEDVREPPPLRRKFIVVEIVFKFHNIDREQYDSEPL